MDSCAYLQMPPPKKKSSSPPYHQYYNLFLVPAPVASRLQCSWLPIFHFVSSLRQCLVRLRPITGDCKSHRNTEAPVQPDLHVMKIMRILKTQFGVED